MSAEDLMKENRALRAKVARLESELSMHRGVDRENVVLAEENEALREELGDSFPGNRVRRYG